MEQDINFCKSVPPLFPAFNLSSGGNVESSPLFPAANISSVNTDQPKPLFPAYHSKNVADGNKIDQEWLCNSSYAPSNTEIVYNVQEKIIEVEKPLVEEQKKSKHSKKKKKESYKKYVQSISHVPESDSIRNILNKKIFIEETGLSFERAFRVDPSRDPENIYYEHLEQKNIAKYKLFPKIPIGLTSDQRILWPKQSTSNSKNIFFRYFNKKAIKVLKNISLSEKIDSKTETIVNSNLSFIPIAQDVKKSTVIKDYSSEGYDGVSTSWKEQFLQKTNPKENPVEEVIDLEFRNRTIYFNQKLSESAHDVQLWLEFVNFQDELLNQTNNSSLQYTESAVIEKKIAILDKALRHNPKSVELNIFKLNLCRNLWKPDKLIHCWDELVFLNPNNVLIWQEYLAFILTNVTYFTTARILKLFGKCLGTLSNLSEGIVQSHEAPPDIVPKMLDAFSLMCFVLKSFGYNERAIGAFQALIELNLFGEKAIEVLPISDQISFLEPFWDSGSARFGEEGALGWATTINEQKIAFPKIATQSNLSCIEDGILNKKLSQWETWLQFEKVREKYYWLPWRPDSENDQPDDEVDDVNRTVSFDDVSKFLFRVSKEEHKFLIILHFFKFLGFNPHNFGCSFSIQTIQNTYLHLDSFDIISKTLKESLFKSITNPLILKEEVWTKDKITFINNVFSQSVSKFSKKYRTLMTLMQLKFYHVCSTQTNNPAIKIDDAKKFAKSILKESENRNCLLLWLEFIKIESLSSKIKTRKTFLTLLASSCNAIAEGNMAMTEMWYFVRSYLDLCLGVQDHSFMDSKILSKEEIISLLVCISCQEKYTQFSTEYNKPTFILRAMSNFKNFLQKELNCIASENFETCSCIDSLKFIAIDLVKCYAYFQYFTQGIEGAMLVFKEVMEFLEINLKETHKKYILELFNIYQADFINLHTWNTTSSTKHLQSFLQSSISIYPNSSSLLFYLIKLKSASAVVSPTRRFFAKILKKSNTLHPVIWIFALASELLIMNSILEQQSNGIQYIDQSSCQGINWKIRSLFEKALDSSTCNALPFLWQSYMKFEILNKEVEKAQSIYHRALQNCGWYKDLVMDGIEYFHDNLKQMVDFMIEKQMRVHTPVEEISLLMEHCNKE